MSFETEIVEILDQEEEINLTPFQKAYLAKKIWDQVYKVQFINKDIEYGKIEDLLKKERAELINLRERICDMAIKHHELAEKCAKLALILTAEKRKRNEN